jgi:hypothetical protein
LWEVDFELPQPSCKGGWLVQEVHIKENVIEKNGQIRKSDPKKKRHYWEAWKVQPTQKKVDLYESFGVDLFHDLKDPNFPPDKYQWAPTHGTKGSRSWTGKIMFFEDLTLPNDFKPNNNETYAGAVRSTARRPSFWKDDGTPHNLSTEWNCTVDEYWGETVVK